ncbi:hypothetical protein JHW43_006070 [Diplocarpon mali]|nr:hypothetical protein JHW43_006070 [Diplocarpon mali]
MHLPSFPLHLTILPYMTLASAYASTTTLHCNGSVATTTASVSAASSRTASPHATHSQDVLSLPLSEQQLDVIEPFLTALSLIPESFLVNRTSFSAFTSDVADCTDESDATATATARGASATPQGFVVKIRRGSKEGVESDLKSAFSVFKNVGKVSDKRGLSERDAFRDLFMEMLGSGMCLSKTLMDDPLVKGINCAIKLAGVAGMAIPLVRMLKIKTIISKLGGVKKVMKLLGKGKKGNGQGEKKTDDQGRMTRKPDKFTVQDLLFELAGVADAAKTCRYLTGE